MAYLSPSHFSKLMTEYTNEAPSTHIQRRRLKYAQQLLLTTDYSLAQIASESGYADSNYFSRIFKKTFQLTPSEWQKQHSGLAVLVDEPHPKPPPCHAVCVHP